MILSPESRAQKTVVSAENKSFINAFNETIYVHSNATTFVSGETLYYKLYCLNPVNYNISTLSKIAYVELIDSNKENVFKQKFFLKNGTGQGDFFIPTTLQTGNYKLIAYTNWMLNKSEEACYQMDITIINPFQVSQEMSIKPANPSISSGENKSENQSANELNTSENKIFSIGLDKKTYTNRELVNLNIKTSNIDFENGSYSLSVRKVENLPSKKQLNSIDFAKSFINPTKNFQGNENEIFLPELRGEVISGKIASKTGQERIENIAIALSLPGKPFVFKIIKTNASGEFIFNLEKAYFNSNMVIQVMDKNKENFIVTLDKPRTIDYSKFSSQPFKDLSTELKESLEKRSIASQIENAYYTKKSDSIAKSENYKTFYDPLAKDYILDDYSRFPTIKETIVEVINDVYFTKENNKYSIRIEDHDPLNELPQPTLVLVDGLLIQDIDELFDFKAENIYKVSFIAGGYYYGTSIFNGLLNFITKNGNYESKLSGDYIIKPKIIRPFINKKYYQPDYSASSKNDRIPDYRYQLLWIPDLKLESKESLTSFYTSDVSGIFEITIEGFTAKGTPISLKDIIEVK